MIGVPNAQDFRPALFTYNYKWLSGAAFIQNDWKIKPNFTLNLGLRYSLQLPRTEANDNQGVFRPDLAQSVTLTTAPTATTATQRGAIAIASGVAVGAAIPDFVPLTASVVPFAFSGRGGRSRYITEIDKTAFEPRFGFAWSPKFKVFGIDLEKRSLVIRGGFGISHAPINETTVRLILISADLQRQAHWRPDRAAVRTILRRFDLPAIMHCKVRPFLLIHCLEQIQTDWFFSSALGIRELL